jgi:DtxR family Mn-dependent transcriptional regulator
MVEPLHALLVAASILLAAGLLFWPRYGCVRRWRQLRRMTQRILIEDALKHLYKYEYRRQIPTVESLSGALELSGNRTAGLLAHLEVLQLVQTAGGTLGLTAEGRAYALHVIRAHRLWEHYLAEETGLSEAAWHSEAESREHDLSRAEADHLDDRMGHPVYDSHGDPIPTASGDIAPRSGRPLTALEPGEFARIIHVEDEPEDVYLQVIAAGLHPGMQVELTAITSEEVRFLADGRECVLIPVAAANLFVTSLPEEERMKGPYQPLTRLKTHQKGKVVHISPACRGLERRRLLDLGVVPGTEIEVGMRSPSGDPTAYRIRGATIALRNEQASQIHIAKQMEA